MFRRFYGYFQPVPLGVYVWKKFACSTCSTCSTVSICLEYIGMFHLFHLFLWGSISERDSHFTLVPPMSTGYLSLKEICLFHLFYLIHLFQLVTISGRHSQVQLIPTVPRVSF